MVAEQMKHNLKKLNVIIQNLKEPAIDLNEYQEKQADHELVCKVLSEIVVPNQWKIFHNNMQKYLSQYLRISRTSK